jgi:hypothetical protein
LLKEKGESTKMNNQVKKLASIFFVAMLAFSALAIAVPTVMGQTAAVSIIPSYQEFGPAPVVGTEFSVDCVVSDVTGLYGVDIQIEWDTAFLTYVNHTKKIPVETYSDGILHSPTIPVKDTVDPLAGTYWLSEACMAPAPVFDGTGKAFTMWFRITDQPYAPAPDAVVNIGFTSTGLSDNGGNPLPGGWNVNNGTVVIKSMPFSYPILPFLKVTPSSVSGVAVGDTFVMNTYILGKNATSGEEGDLHPWWDVAGFDVVMNFKRPAPPELICEALSVTVDPDGTFASFWPGGIIVVEQSIDNVAGTVHVAFLGIPGNDSSHTAPYGNFRIFSVTFNATYEGSDLSVDITLKNPPMLIHQATPDADAGLIDLTSPENTTWTMVNPDDYGTNVYLETWVDIDLDGELSAGDKLILTDTSTSKWYRYVVNDFAGTLDLTQQPFQLSQEFTVVDGIPAVWDPPVVVDTGTYNDKDGNPYWTGNISVNYAVSSVNSFLVTPPFSAPYYLTEGVDFVVHTGTPEIELLTPLDEWIVEHYVAGVNATPAGWPAITYMASGFENIWVDFMNGTSRWATNTGYRTGPPNEYWYEGDWPNEIEGWYALDFGYPSPEAWPLGTHYWINYSVPATVLIDYNAVPDPTPYVVEFDGTYADFLALGAPVNTMWNEVYAWPLRNHNCTAWSDEDTSGDITVGDILTLEDNYGITAPYLVDNVATDIIVNQIKSICDVNPSDPFYGDEIIVNVAGYPQPDQALCPWHSQDSSVPLPHEVENAQVTIPEFSGSVTLVLSFIVATIAVALAKKKSTKTKTVPINI